MLNKKANLETDLDKLEQFVNFLIEKYPEIIQEFREENKRKKNK